MRLIDTNVLMYAASLRPSEEAKTRIALVLLGRDDVCLSVQILQEFYYQATRPSRPNRLSHQQAMIFLDTFAEPPVQSLDQAWFATAVSICRRSQLSYWDAAILAAARRMNCDAVYSENLSDRPDYARLRVINPFTHD